MRIVLLTGETSVLGAEVIQCLIQRADCRLLVVFLRYRGPRGLSLRGLRANLRHSGPDFLAGKVVDLASLHLRALGHRLGLTRRPHFACEHAIWRGIPYVHTNDANGPETLELVRRFNPDVLVTAGFGQILKAPLLTLARRAALNLHPSLLPRHPGANPLRDVLAAGDRETGATIHRLTLAIDAGEILGQRAFAIPPGIGQRTLGHLAARTGADELSRLIGTLP